jgi:hypothetical protein
VITTGRESESQRESKKSQRESERDREESESQRRVSEPTFDHNHQRTGSQRDALLLVENCAASAASILPHSDGAGARLEHVDPVAEVAELVVRPRVEHRVVAVLVDRHVDVVAHRDRVAESDTGVLLRTRTY